MSRRELQDKCLQDQEKYHKDQQREKNELVAMERLTILDKDLKEHVTKVVKAASSDQTERNFINAVSNTKTAGRKATRAVSQLGDNAYRLRKGKSANPAIVEALQKSIRVDVSSKLEELKTFAISILEQQETNNKEVTECHKAARAIDDAIIALEHLLIDFEGSLEDQVIEDSVDIYQQVVDACKELGKAVSSMPAVSQSNHVKESENSALTSSAREFNFPDICNEVIGIGKSQFESLSFENRNGMEGIVLRHFMNIERDVFKFKMMTRLGDDNSDLVNDNASVVPLAQSDSKTAWHKENMKNFLEKMRDELALVFILSKDIYQKFEQSDMDKLMVIKHLPQLAFSLLSLLTSTKELISSGINELEMIRMHSKHSLGFLNYGLL